MLLLPVWALCKWDGILFEAQKGKGCRPICTSKLSVRFADGMCAGVVGVCGCDSEGGGEKEGKEEGETRKTVEEGDEDEEVEVEEDLEIDDYEAGIFLVRASARVSCKCESSLRQLWKEPAAVGAEDSGGCQLQRVRGMGRRVPTGPQTLHSLRVVYSSL